jgi:hypothetical protein
MWFWELPVHQPNIWIILAQIPMVYSKIYE